MDSNIRKAIIALAVFALLFGVMVRAEARLITFDFTGTVTTVRDDCGVVGTIVPGTSLTGRLTYDTSVPETFPGVYNFATETVPNGIYITIGSFMFNSICCDLFDIFITNNGIDAIGVQEELPTSNDLSFFTDVIVLTLVDSTGTVFSDTSLPTTLDLDDFDSSVVEIVGFCGTSGIFDIFGTLNTLTLRAPHPVDIKPQSCPNPLNVKSRGVLPVAILGTADFDVTTIDPASIRLEGVAPIRSAFEDVATPFESLNGEADASNCTDEGSDGFMDLTLKFRTQEIVAALGGVQDGEVLILTLTGILQDGGFIQGEDVVVILKKGNQNHIEEVKKGKK